MRLSQITLSGVVLLAASASAQQVEFSVRPGALRTGASPAPAASQLPPAPLNGSDACATADPLGSATGAIPYDNSIATVEPTIGQSSFTGGYCNYGCAEYGSAQVAVLTDVWFSWVAPAAGLMRVTTCPVQNDTKIGVYAGPGCPTGTTCLSCNDDFHFQGGTTVGLVDSILYVPVVASQVILIQVGQSSFNVGAAGFVGTFNIDLDPAHETGVVPFDDNAAETNLSFGAPGDGQLGINRLGNVGDVTTVTGVQVCWGWTGATGFTAGHPAYVGIWADGASQDGDPTDAMLLETVATTVANPGTDTYVSVPFTAPHTINGVYFIGYGAIETPQPSPGVNHFPVSADNTTCNIQPNTAWWVNNTAAANNLANLAGNTTPPHRLEDPVAGFPCAAQGPATWGGILHSAFAIRADVQAGPAPLGTPVCFGDTAADCPCSSPGGTTIANPGATGRGCGNAVFPAGAQMTATGNPSDSAADTVILSVDNVSGPGLFIQANGLVGPVINFNDGKLCAAAGIIRLGVSFPTAGVATYPSVTSPTPLHTAGAPVQLGGNPTAPTKYYQLWYRDATAGFCNPRTDNMSSGLTIVWTP